MQTFSIIIQTALNNYKAILRRSLPLEESAEKIKKLRLRRKQIQEAPDIVLYHIAQNVIKDIEEYTANMEEEPSWYFGVADFMQHLKNTLAEYHIENNHIVHPKQKASRALLDIIQLLVFNPIKDDLEQKTDDCIRTIAKYGAPDQYNILRATIKKHLDKNPDLFENLARKFNRYLDEYAHNRHMA